MGKQNSEYQKAWAKILAKAWSDELFKQRLIKNPKEIFQEYGIPIEEGINYQVHENTKKVHHIVIPESSAKELSEEEIKKMKIAGGDLLDKLFGYSN